MKQKKRIYFIILSIILISGILLINKKETNQQEKINKISAKIINIENNKVTLQDEKNVIYTFKENLKEDIGTNIMISYTGSLKKNKELQTGKIKKYQIIPTSNDENGISTNWLDKGIFKNYYILANNLLQKMSLEEKISQILLVRFPDNNGKEILQKYQFGGYVFFEKDFKDKTKKEVQEMMKELQSVSKIKILTAVDEEGGEVVRVSSNKNLVSEKFKSPRELYQEGGFEKIKKDTIEKSDILNQLGLNLNLAPVVDVSTNSNDYIYKRTLGENTELTKTYAKTVIEASKNTNVSYTLKHFPGYGNNKDNHTSSVTDERTYSDIEKNDLPPFQAGIQAQAESILVSHNTIKNIDDKNPASLSPSIHNVLRNNLGFTGIIITDDLAMGAVSSIEDVAVKAILAGNDLLITTDYEKSISSIKKALEKNTLTEEMINKLAFRVLAWKYYKGLIIENQK